MKHKTYEKALEHWSQAFAFAVQLCRNRHEAEELCQEAYLRLWSMDRPLDVSRPLLPLILTTIKNLFRNRAQRFRPDALEHPDVLVDDEAEDPAAHATAAEQGELVQQALERMNPLWRAALYLADGIGMSYGEIAEILDRTEDVVRVTLHRARLRVRVLLNTGAKS